MKTNLKILTAAGLALGLAPWAHAGYSVYPPTVMNGYTFFEDSDNATSAPRCADKSSNDGICIYAYVLPKGVDLAKTDSGVPMLTQGVFFGSSWADHRVVYNLTLEPDYSDYDPTSDQIRSTLAKKYGVAAENVSVSPINVGQMQFLVRNTFGTGASVDPAHASAGTPVASASPSPAPSASPTPPAVIALGTTYTETLVPQWTGDFHNIGSRFSVSITGPVWDLEPGLQNMFLNKGGNAAVGQVSFGIPVKAVAVNATVDCDLQKFRDIVENTTKQWNITHVTGPGYDIQTFDNEEWNAIRANLNVTDLCKINTLEDKTIPSDTFFSQRSQEIFDQLFKQAFTDIQGQPLPDLIGGKDEKYTLLNSSSSSSANGHITIDLHSEVVFYLNSDLDFYAGDVTRDNLSPESKYLCEHFQEYTNGQCEDVCDPFSEVYLKHHPRADAKGCVNITTIPLTQ